VAWAEQLPSGLYRGCYRDRTGKRRTVAPVRQKAQALRDAGAAEDKARRTRRDLDAGRTTWGEWADEWLPTRRLEASTEKSGASYLKRVRAKWDDVRLDEITSMELQRWVRQLERELAPSSIEKAFYLLSASLKAALIDGRIEVNPCRGVELPPLPPAEERYLTPAETDQILYRLDGVYRSLAELMLGTGVRIGEACGLHWHRVNLDAGTIDVIETWDPTALEMKAYPKSKRRRTVPITGELGDLLVRLYDARRPAQSCGRPHARYRAARRRAAAKGIDAVDRCRAGLVLPGPKGAVLDPRNFGKRQWKTACKAAGVAEATPHALRHTYASLLATAGLPLLRLQEVMGHERIETTMRYAHLMTDGHDEVRAALARGARGGADPGNDQSAAVRTWRRPRAV
jgi:integrase